MRKILAKLIVLCVSLCATTAKAETNDEMTDVLTYMKRAMMFNKSLPQEKVYLHFDNTGYFKGETIWFKAYVVRADNSLPTDLSRIVYVELVDPTGDVVETRKLPVIDGVANGDIKLEGLLGSGFYEVRAYTRYMTNWGNGGIFSRVFPIFEAPKTDGDYSNMTMRKEKYNRRLPNIRSNDVNEGTVQKDRKLCVHFYPEGGKLVEGLTSRVAFLVTDKAGKHESYGGALLDENKEFVAATNTQHDGMGAFELTPDSKPKYLRVQDTNGKQHDFLLPQAEKEGVVISVDMMRDDEVSVVVKTSQAFSGRLLGYTLMHNGRIISADTVTCSQAVRIPYDRTALPGGVSQITFFTSDGRVQAERQFFICPKSSVADTVRVTTPQAYPKPCKKVILDIAARPNSSLSLSAMDRATMVNGKEGNALTWMLLTSDVKGYVANPDYYFEADDKAHRMAADLLMMVQGWRRYDWALMADAVDVNAGYSLFDTLTAKFKEPLEDKLYLFGTLKPKKKKNTVENVWLEAVLYNKSGQSLKGTAKTDSLGAYAFGLPDVNGDWVLSINTGKEDKEGYWKDLDYYVGINRHFSPKRRLLAAGEMEPLELVSANLFADKVSRDAAVKDQVYVPIQKRDHVLPTIVVKSRRHFTEGAGAAWRSEERAKYYATMYYNADMDADRFQDLGMEVPTVISWLHMRNPFFDGGDKDFSLTESGATEAVDASYAMDKTVSLGELAGDMANENDAIQTSQMTSGDDKGFDDTEFTEQFSSTDKQHRVFTDGLGYKNRPIVWILNNTYAAITNLGVSSSFSTFEVLERCIEDMPLFIDEIKSAYVSEEPGAYSPYLICPDLRGKNPVTVFLYTHTTLQYKPKGIRKTYFSGYNKASTFEMDDYSALPAMDDFRRTLYWEPNVKTDSEGKARVEFWNNSSCHEMYISVEGMDPKGHFMVNE